MRPPRFRIRTLMIAVAVAAGLLALGRLLQGGVPHFMVLGVLCLIASAPMLAALIEFIRTLHWHDAPPPE